MANVKRAWKTLVLSITTPGTAEQAASNFVPENHTVVITNRRSSAGTMYFGDSKANAESDTARKELIPGQSFAIQIQNTNLLFYDAVNSADKSEVVVVQD